MNETAKIINETSNISIMPTTRQTATASTNISQDGSVSVSISINNPAEFYVDEVSETALHTLLKDTIAKGKEKYLANKPTETVPVETTPEEE